MVFFDSQGFALMDGNGETPIFNTIILESTPTKTPSPI